MHLVAFIAGVLCVCIVLLDAFQTIILPRRATGRFRLTRIFYILTWNPWLFVARHLRNLRKRETFLSFYGPLSLILLLIVWASGMVLGFALLFYADGSPFHDATKPAPFAHLQASSFASDLYVSGTTIFTLGLGDVTPLSPGSRALVILESGTGLGFLAAIMGYFPVLYGAFSLREVSISLLDARAGSPPTAAELMRRHAYEGAGQALSVLLVEWERWSAELLESHISYPQLCYFRSQHTNQSWLSSLTAILDTSALLIAGVRGYEARQAQLTFAMARHALVDLAQIFSRRPISSSPDRLPPERCQRLYDTLLENGVKLCRDDSFQKRLRQLRDLYEGYADSLSRYLAMPLPPWVTDQPHKDNWQTVARLGTQAGSGPAPDQDSSAAGAKLVVPGLTDHHDF